MLSTSLFPALDLLTNPVLITETDGSLLYRNEEALKRLQIPHLTRKIVSHFTPEDRHALRHYATELPAFLEYATYENTVTVFVDTLTLDGRDVLFFFFSHLFDFSVMEHQKLEPAQAILNEFSADKLATLAITAYEREDLPDAIRNRPKHLASTRIFQKLVSEILDELQKDGNKALYPLCDAFELFSLAAETTLSRFGLNVTLPILSAEKETLLIDFKPFVLLFSQILVLLTEINLTKNALISLTQHDNTLIFEIQSTVKREYHRIFIGGAESLSYLLPGTLLDLFTFNTLCKGQGFKFDFALRDNGNRNLTVHLSVPIEKAYAMNDSAINTKPKLLALIQSYTLINDIDQDTSATLI